MEYGYSILMGIFAGALLLYAGLMALTKDYKMLPYRARTSVKPKNPKKYMTQLSKVMVAALIVLIGTGVLFIWLGTKIVHNEE